MADYKIPTPTQAPVPSADIRNVVFAGAKVDEWATSGNYTYTDRFGKQHLTAEGINNQFQQFLLNSGYEQLADYTDGPITFERRNQITAYNGEYYRPKASVSLPYTTTGNTATTWETDKDNFVAVGDAALRQELAAKTGALLIGGLGFITPEMFGAVGDGVTDDVTALQAMMEFARANNTLLIQGQKLYAVSEPVYVDNFSAGVDVLLAGLVTTSSFVGSSSWRTAPGAITVGMKSNGSQVGLRIRVNYFNGGKVATLYRLAGYGCGGSDFTAGRCSAAVGVYNDTESTLSGSSSNRVHVLYAYNGKYGVMSGRANSTYVTEGQKFEINFMTNLDYGGILLFDGAQYSQVYGSDIDFCGKWLVQLKVDKLPTSNIRGQNISYNGSTFEVMDYYEQPKGSYYLLIIDKQDCTGGNSSFSTATSTAIAEVNTPANTYVLSGVTTSTANQAYFDLIHGFQGAAFSRCNFFMGYLSNHVGGNWNGSTLFANNSFAEMTNRINNLWFRQQGTKVSIVDMWTGIAVLNCDTSNSGYQTLPGGMTVSGKMYYASNRLYGSEYSTTLSKSVSAAVRTFNLAGDGTILSTKEKWTVHLCGPMGLTGIGGTAQVAVSTTGIEILANNITGVTLSASGYVLSAVQGSQTAMQVTLMFERNM